MYPGTVRVGMSSGLRWPVLPPGHVRG